MLVVWTEGEATAGGEQNAVLRLVGVLAKIVRL